MLSRLHFHMRPVKHGSEEVDRARAILTHAASLADPRSEPAFWDAWHAFEVEHGGEASFREMLRVKRSVAAARSGAHVALAPTAAPPPPLSPWLAPPPRPTPWPPWRRLPRRRRRPRWPRAGRRCVGLWREAL